MGFSCKTWSILLLLFSLPMGIASSETVEELSGTDDVLGSEKNTMYGWVMGVPAGMYLCPLKAGPAGLLSEMHWCGYGPSH